MESTCFLWELVHWYPYHCGTVEPSSNSGTSISYGDDVERMTHTESVPAHLKLLAGGGASVLSKTAVAPFERTKLLLQTSRGTERRALPLMRGVVREQGVRALWRGNFANCMRVFPTSALRFFFFDYYQRAAGAGAPEGKPMSMGRQLAAGAMSGATTLTLTYPLDLLRTRIATDMSSRKVGYIHKMVDALKESGPLGLYRGYLISVMEIAPYLSISMGGYHWLKDTYATPGAVGDQMPFQRLFFGWLSGSIASLVCYPLDTVKRRMMVISTTSDGRSEGFSIRSSVRQIWQKGGVPEFYRGGFVNVANSGPAAAILFFANDYLRDHLFRSLCE